MYKCEECGKMLGILHAYNHPALGKKHTVCKNCFDRVSDSLKKWTDFILPYADLIKSNKYNNFDFNCKNLSMGCMKL